MKNNRDEFEIIYEQIEATDAEIEVRLFKALSMLISEEELYGE